MGAMERHTMKSLFLSSIVLLSLKSGFFCFAEDCEQGCQTTIVVQDCDGAVVSGAVVQVKLCCGTGQEQKATTNTNGEANFSCCIKDVCSSRVLFQGFAPKSLDKGECSVNGKKSRCTVRICSH